MSGWDQHYGGFDANQYQNQGFYDPTASNYDYSNYDSNTGGGGVDYQAPSGQFGDMQFNGANNADNDEFANEPPLLEELGINLDHIIQKTLTVLNPLRSPPREAAGDADLAGPLVFCLAFGSLLLLTGKIHFNYIYGIGLMGCVANYGLLTLMSTAPVSITVVVSVLGYCILPIVALSALSVLISLTGILGTIFTILAVLRSSLSASKLFVTAFEMEHQQLLVAYPCSMLYAVFALITMF